MKKLLYVFLIVTAASAVIYFNQDRMALEVLQTQNPQTKTQYKFSDENQLTIISIGDKEITFTLDGYGRRYTKFINEKVIEKYLWQGDEKLYIVTDKNDNVLREYLYKNKQDLLPYGMKTANETYRFIYNKTRSLRVVLDSKNKIVKILDYDENGSITRDTNPTLEVDFTYAGGTLERVSGLLFFLEGVYNPKGAKWITKIKNDDIIDNLKTLSQMSENEVYICQDTLDTYYHSFLCTNGNCGGLYANDYLNYFNGTGVIVDNSKYFNKNRCNKLILETSSYDTNQFSLCVDKKIRSKEIKHFDALSHNCHHEVDKTIEDCKKTSQRKDS